MNKITLALSYYDNPEMLRLQFQYWQKYPKGVNIIVVDDGSPNHPAKDVFSDSLLNGVDVKLYRIEENIPWNSAGARNLAFSEASDGWVIATDIDHVLPAESMENLFTKKLKPRRFYSLARRRMVDLKKQEEMHPHRESFLMTKRLFWKVGGYDEDFVGYWNGPFTGFRLGLKRVARCVALDDVWLLLFGYDIIPNASTMSLGRRGSEYDINKNKEMKKPWRRAMKRHRPENPLRFKWERVL